MKEKMVKGLDLLSKYRSELIDLGMLICSFALLGLVVFLYVEAKPTHNYKDSVFELVDEYRDMDICYHKDTGVMYIITNRGDVTMMMDTDGKPYTYKGDD